MKKSELRQIIREEIQKLNISKSNDLNEGIAGIFKSLIKKITKPNSDTQIILDIMADIVGNRATVKDASSYYQDVGWSHIDVGKSVPYSKKEKYRGVTITAKDKSNVNSNVLSKYGQVSIYPNVTMGDATFSVFSKPTTLKSNGQWAEPSLNLNKQIWKSSWSNVNNTVGMSFGKYLNAIAK